jgi:hypothetical protein
MMSYATYNIGGSNWVWPYTLTESADIGDWVNDGGRLFMFGPGRHTSYDPAEYTEYINLLTNITTMSPGAIWHTPSGRFSRMGITVPGILDGSIVVEVEEFTEISHSTATDLIYINDDDTGTQRVHAAGEAYGDGFVSVSYTHLTLPTILRV